MSSDISSNNNSDRQPTAFVYARVSTGRQAKNEISIPDQLKRCHQFCVQQGFKVIGEFSDARTGRTMKRNDLDRMQDEIRSSNLKVDYVIVYTLSRFARNMIGSELLRLDLKKLGTKLISVTQPVADDAGGDMLRSVFNLLDEHTSAETSKHVRRSMKENARQGFWNGGRPPYGFKPINAGLRGATMKKKLAVDPVEAETVKLIFRLYDEGDGSRGPLGVQSVASKLNADGYARRNGNWSVGQVHRVLNDRLYIGEREFSKTRKIDEKIVVPVPPIVDATLFERVQLRLRQQNPKMTPPRNSSSPVLLTGLVTCAYCGGGMKLATGKGGRYRYYACTNRVSKGRSVCAGQRVPMPELDEKVTEVLKKTLLSKKRVRTLLQGLASRITSQNFDEKSRLDALKKDLVVKQGGVTRLYDGVHKGVFTIDDPQLTEMLQKAIAERDIAQKHVEILEKKHRVRAEVSDGKVETFVTFLRSALSSGPVPFRKRYISSIVRSVVVKDGEVVVLLKPFGDSG